MLTVGRSGIKINVRCENFAFTYFFFKFIYFWNRKVRADMCVLQKYTINTKPSVCFDCRQSGHSETYALRLFYQYIISHTGLSYTSRSSCVWLNLSVAEFTWWRLSPRFIYTQWSGSSISTHGLPEVVMHQSFPCSLCLNEWFSVSGNMLIGFLTQKFATTLIAVWGFPLWTKPVLLFHFTSSLYAKLRWDQLIASTVNG